MAHHAMDSRQREAEKALHDQTNILPRMQLLVVFATLAATSLVTFIDQNGVSVTLPTIAADLHAADSISWAGTSSLIANTTFQMLYGRLSDIFGRKVVYLTAIGLLSLAGLLCGLARDAAMFYVFRAVAGIGGGGITNLSMIIVSDIVTLRERGKYQGIIGACVGVANVIGPFLAAAWTQHVTWRAFFWMEAPLALLVGAIVFVMLPSKARTAGFVESARRIDYLGVLASSVGVIFLLIPISGGGAYFEWTSPLVIAMLVIGGVALVVFVVVEWRIAKLPMMPLQVFRDPAVAVILTQSFFLGAVYQSYLYYMPLYLQNVKRYSVLTSAAFTSALVVPQSLVSICSGQYISRRKRYGEVLWSGFGTWTLGAGLMLLYSRHTTPGIIIIPLLLVGLGVGNVFQPTLIAVQAHVPKSKRAVIISNRNFFRCAGGAVGLAVSAAVLQGVLRSHLPAEYGYLAGSTYAVPKSLGPAALDEVLDAYMAASRAVFILQVPLIGLCFLGCCFIRDRGLEPPAEEGEEESEMEMKTKSGGKRVGNGGKEEEEGKIGDGSLPEECSGMLEEGEPHDGGITHVRSTEAADALNSK